MTNRTSSMDMQAALSGVAAVRASSSQAWLWWRNMIPAAAPLRLW
jgi:hypothetical protein